MNPFARFRWKPRTFAAFLLAGFAALPAPIAAQDLRLERSALKPLAHFQDCAACPEMIVMPSGAFLMGATPEESQNPFDAFGKGASGRIRQPGEINIMPAEHPRHRVEMDIPYAISTNETTRAQWMACVADGGCTYVPSERVLMLGGYRILGPDHPVIHVSYLDAQQYIDWLNLKAGAEVYRLPTEAEWEFAARAGTTTPFAQGTELTADQANFSRAATEHVLGRGDSSAVSLPKLTNRDAPVPVQALDAANAWGVRHMSGNVSEVTLSCWSDQHLGLSTDSAYWRDAQSQGSCRRVGKGGDYRWAMDGLRLACRARPTEDSRESYFGFRVVRDLKEMEKFDDNR
jgi:formylglycine-generating enzyme required for sulfatase activity